MTPRGGGGGIHAVRPVCVKQTEGINEKLGAIFCLINFRAEDGVSRCATTDIFYLSVKNMQVYWPLCDIVHCPLSPYLDITRLHPYQRVYMQPFRAWKYNKCVFTNKHPDTVKDFFFFKKASHLTFKGFQLDTHSFVLLDLYVLWIYLSALLFTPGFDVEIWSNNLARWLGSNLTFFSWKTPIRVVFWCSNQTN